MKLIESNKFFITIILDLASILIHKLIWTSAQAPIEQLKLRKKSDTIFILGTGSSINEISKREWSQISKSDTIGVNFFCLHKFIPKYLSFENSKLKEKQRNIDLQFEFLNEKALISGDLMFIERDVSFLGLIGLGDKTSCALRFPSRVLKFARCRVSAATEKQFNTRFRLIHKTLARFNLSCLLSVRSSVVSLAEICVRLGYRNIVFAGVDLNSIRYFYYEDDYKLVPEQLQTAGKHLTENNIKTFYNTSNILVQLATLNSDSTKFFTTSLHSELANYFDVYDIEAHES